MPEDIREGIPQAPKRRGRPPKVQKPQKQPKRYKAVPLTEADVYWKKGW